MKREPLLAYRVVLPDLSILETGNRNMDAIMVNGA